jgi:hypothetical protein
MSEPPCRRGEGCRVLHTFGWLVFAAGIEEGGDIPEIFGSVSLSSFQKFPSQTRSLELAQMALFLY